MDTVRRQLVVVRHAKSDWPVGVPDRERPLAERGRRDAPVMGRRLRGLLTRIDVAVVSPAERTRATWELMSGLVGPVGDRRVDDRVYHASGHELLDVATDLPDTVGTALLLGHEPGVSELVLTLADGSSPELVARVAAKFPTCAAAVLTLDGPWDQLRPGAGRLAAFLTPKDLSR